MGWFGSNTSVSKPTLRSGDRVVRTRSAHGYPITLANLRRLVSETEDWPETLTVTSSYSGSSLVLNVTWSYPVEDDNDS